MTNHAPGGSYGFGLIPTPEMKVGILKFGETKRIGPYVCMPMADFWGQLEAGKYDENIVVFYATHYEITKDRIDLPRAPLEELINFPIAAIYVGLATAR